MPDLSELLETFPEDPNDFIWDIKVHMLMPGQFPCIPNWHFDNVPRVDGKQDFSKVQLDKPMYLWLSGGPLTEFRNGKESWCIEPETWTKFTQLDCHRGHVSKMHTWRGFIRATHKDILNGDTKTRNPQRRHCQVYLNAGDFTW